MPRHRFGHQVEQRRTVDERSIAVAAMRCCSSKPGPGDLAVAYRFSPKRHSAA